MKKISIFFFGMTVLVLSANAQSKIFSETFGKPSDSKNEIIDSHVWDNGAPVSYSWTQVSGTPGSLNVRTSGTLSNDPSKGYASASGSGNLYFNGDITNSFTIKNITTSDYTNIQLSFGIIGSKTAGDAKKLKVEYSTNSTDFTQIAVSNLNNLNATITNWEVISGVSLPAASNLSLKFSTPNAGEIRLDDIIISGTSNSTSVNSLSSDARKIIVSNSTIILTGFTTGQLDIYNILGERVFTSELKETIQPQLPTGIYVVKIGNFIQKIYLK
jgi:hypothetical protein